jgi:hypothetical protein
MSENRIDYWEPTNPRPMASAIAFLNGIRDELVRDWERHVELCRGSIEVNGVTYVEALTQDEREAAVFEYSDGTRWVLAPGEVPDVVLASYRGSEVGTVLTAPWLECWRGRDLLG